MFGQGISSSQIVGNGPMDLVQWNNFSKYRERIFNVSHTHIDIPDGGYADLVVAFNGLALHTFAARWWTEGKAHLELYAEVEFSTIVGEEIRPAPMISPPTFTVKSEFYASPHIIDEGRYVFRQLLNGGTAPCRFGGFHEIAYEWAIKPPAKPMMARVINLSGAPSDVSYQLISYEGDEE